MKKLIDLNKDRRFKLTVKQTEKIRLLKGKGTAQSVADKFNVSRQRVDQLWANEIAMLGNRQRDTRIKTLRYRTDDKFRKRVLERKKEYYLYKSKIIRENT